MFSLNPSFKVISELMGHVNASDWASAIVQLVALLYKVNLDTLCSWLLSLLGLFHALEQTCFIIIKLKFLL